MSEKKTEENKKKIKELADWMNKALDNPRVTDEDLEYIAGTLRSVDAHKLDTAANGCNG
jgi:hypothetical protein